MFPLLILRPPAALRLPVPPLDVVLVLPAAALLPWPEDFGAVELLFEALLPALFEGAPLEEPPDLAAAPLAAAPRPPEDEVLLRVEVVLLRLPPREASPPFFATSFFVFSLAEAKPFLAAPFEEAVLVALRLPDEPLPAVLAPAFFDAALLLPALLLLPCPPEDELPEPRPAVLLEAAFEELFPAPLAEAPLEGLPDLTAPFEAPLGATPRPPELLEAPLAGEELLPPEPLPAVFFVAAFLVAFAMFGLI